MSEKIDNNEVQKEEVVKRGRGRPKKNSPPVIKEKKKMGQLRLYAEGYHNHTFAKVLVDRNEYYKLLEIEKKYLEIKKSLLIKCI